MEVHKIRLIDNNYNLDHASQLLKKLLEAKMSFIEDQINEAKVKDKEQFNHLESRIKDLKAEIRTLDLFIEDYDGENVEMQIGSTIVMSIENV